METVYLGIIVFLFLLAIFDLVVGVSNDAVNFLNSAIGAKAASFRTFAEVCIRNRLYSVLRAAARDKHSPLNQSVPLDPPFFDSNSYTSGTNDLAQGNPETFLIDREHTAALLAGVRKQLSEFEAKILGYYLDGLSCREIAETVGKPPKSVDNAVQRIRRKVARQLLSGDLSGS